MITVRLFVAMELSPESRRALCRTSDALRAQTPGWRDEKWVPHHALHATASFLGDVDESLVPSLCEALEQSLKGMSAAQGVLGPLEPKPSVSRARHVWARVDDPDGSLREIARRVADAVRPFHCVEERRDFVGHVTIVRFRRARRVRQTVLDSSRQQADCDGGLMSVGAVTLYESRLEAGGPTYRKVWCKTLI